MKLPQWANSVVLAGRRLLQRDPYTAKKKVNSEEDLLNLCRELLSTKGEAVGITYVRILRRGEALGGSFLGLVRRGEASGASCRRASRRGEALGKRFVCPRRGFMHVLTIIPVLRGLD